jgi:hypothetical protein
MMKRSLLGMAVAPGEMHGRADGSTPPGAHWPDCVICGSPRHPLWARVPSSFKSGTQEVTKGGYARHGSSR